MAATNGFILRGPGRDVHAWMQLIERLDRPPSPLSLQKGEPKATTRKALERRLAELETRVAELEAGGRKNGAKK